MKTVNKITPSEENHFIQMINENTRLKISVLKMWLFEEILSEKWNPMDFYMPLILNDDWNKVDIDKFKKFISYFFRLWNDEYFLQMDINLIEHRDILIRLLKWDWLPTTVLVEQLSDSLYDNEKTEDSEKINIAKKFIRDELVKERENIRQIIGINNGENLDDIEKLIDSIRKKFGKLKI